MLPDQLQRVQKIRKNVIRLLILTLAIAMLFIEPAYADTTFYHFLLEATGVVLILICIGWRLWCTLYVGGRKASQLVIDGPYSISRNPLYVGSIVGAAGLGLQSGILTVGFLCATGCWAVFRGVVANEEKFLRAKFGQVYESYHRTVPRFGPRFSLYRDAGVYHTFDPVMLANCLRDSSLFLLVIPFSEVVEELHNVGAFARIVTLP